MHYRMEKLIKTRELPKGAKLNLPHGLELQNGELAKQAEFLNMDWKYGRACLPDGSILLLEATLEWELLKNWFYKFMKKKEWIWGLQPLEKVQT